MVVGEDEGGGRGGGLHLVVISPDVPRDQIVFARITTKTNQATKEASCYGPAPSKVRTFDTKISLFFSFFFKFRPMLLRTVLIKLY